MYLYIYIYYYFFFLDIKPNYSLFKKSTKKSNIPLRNASSIKDLSVRFNKIK